MAISRIPLNRLARYADACQRKYLAIRRDALMWRAEDCALSDILDTIPSPTRHTHAALLERKNHAHALRHFHRHREKLARARLECVVTELRTRREALAEQQRRYRTPDDSPYLTLVPTQERSA